MGEVFAIKETAFRSSFFPLMFITVSAEKRHSICSEQGTFL